MTLLLWRVKKGIEQKLLPFFIQSEVFWKWAIQTSSGSLSPRTKFKSLAELDISLKSQNEQQKQVILF
uniref:Uncharacterized protein n=1 Tax=Arsenophonus endosymbiont of Trialeurodes vaporariorum TaxID=235567 RepID=A0A3B0LYY5_9GAMM